MHRETKSEKISGLIEHIGAESYKKLQKRVASAPEIYSKSDESKGKIKSWLEVN